MDNEKTKLDALKHLSETHRFQHNERRKHEWKIVLTVLTFYVLAVWARIKSGSDLTDNHCLIWVFVLSLAAATSTLLGFFTLASNTNKVLAEEAEAKIRVMAELDPPEEEKESQPQERGKKLHPLEREKEVWTFWRDLLESRTGRWGWILQTVLVFFFSIGAAWLLTTKTLG